VTALRPKLQNLLNQSGAPQILLRIGYPEKDIHAAPRRPLEDVLV